MKIKLGRIKRDFLPERIDWKHQSSLDSQFGIWNTRKTDVFVKRMKGEPTGWALLKKLNGGDLPHMPPLVGLHEENGTYFAFWKFLEGDTLANILQSRGGENYFRNPGLSHEDRLQIIITIFGLLKYLNQRGFWYPDLDWKNIFIHKEGTGYEVCLIDLDSAAPHSMEYSPDSVSQKLWEGMAKTCKEAGQALISRGSSGNSHVAVHGEAMNQSMVLLLAYSLIRLGNVPPDLPLYDPLVNPRQPEGEAIRALHQQLLKKPVKWSRIEELLARYLKLSPDQFAVKSQRYRTSRQGFVGWIRSRFRR